jgi:hypothetical protein
MKLSSTPDNQVACLISFPALDELPLQAVAINLDRHGAVVHLLDQTQIAGSLVATSVVEVQVGLPPHGEGCSRLLHCLGRVVRQSRDSRRRLWLVLRFSQIFVRSHEDEVSGESNASVSDNRRGVCDPTITEGRQLGDPPQPSSITQGE